MTDKSLFDLPEELLKKIVHLADNDRSLRLTCFKFYEFICDKNKKNEYLTINTNYLVNPEFDFDRALESAEIEFKISDSNYKFVDLKEKIESFLHTYGDQVKSFSTLNNHGKFMEIFTNSPQTFEKVVLDANFAYENCCIEKYSIKVKNLFVGSGIEKECLEIFDPEKLILYIVRDHFMVKYLEIFKKWRNLKEISFNYCDVNALSETLQNIQLEVLNVNTFIGTNEIIQNKILEDQKNLKKLNFDAATKHSWAIICDNSEKLECLEIKFIKTISANDFQKIKQLKKLKSLSISGLTHECFDVLIADSNFFHNLEYLKFKFDFQPTCEDIASLAKNYPHLKTLKLRFDDLSFEIFIAVFRNFNQLSCLKLYGVPKINDELMESFCTSNCKNLNLKELHINFLSFDIHENKLIQWIIENFPNLESFTGFTKRNVNSNDLELFIGGLKKLKEIKGFMFDTCHWTTLKDYGQNLEKFHLDLSELENPNEFLKKSRITVPSSSMHNIFVTRDKEIDGTILEYVDFVLYTEWKKIRIWMDSKREIKNMFIDLSNAQSKIQLKNLAHCLEVIGKNVTHLKLEHLCNHYQLKVMLETFPNCDTLLIQRLNFKQFEQVHRIEHSKLKTIDLCFQQTDSEWIIRDLNNFFNGLELDEVILQNLKIFITFETQLDKAKLHQIVLNKQPQLLNMKTVKIAESNTFYLDFYSE